jgi:PKD repeat protein
LTQLIPLRQIYSQPTARALSGIPIYFWTTTNPYFSTIAQVLGISVGLSLRPTFNWDFGDGSTMKSSSPGGRYPSGEVTHKYLLPGEYQIALTISWAGSWSAQGSSYPVIGDAIVQHLSSSIEVLPAPTYYNQ